MSFSKATAAKVCHAGAFWPGRLSSSTPPTPMPLRERNNFGDPLQRIWEDCIFGLCGVTNFHRRTFSVIVTSDRLQRIAWLDEVGDMVDEYFPAKRVKV